MEPHHTFRLLSIALYLGISFTLARPHLSPDISPSMPPDQSSPRRVFVSSNSPESAPTQSPSSGPAPETPLNYVSFPPSAGAPSDAPSPSASFDDIFSDGQSETDSGGMGLDFDMSASFASVEVDPQITKICDATDHPLLCTTTVLPLLKGQTDVKSVLQVAINAGYSFAKLALSEATKLADNPGNPPETISTLNDCKDSYDTAVYNYENTIAAFSENDIGTVNSMLSAVITFIGDCEDAFSEMGMESPLADYSDKLTNMTSNCLAMVSLETQS